MYSSFRSRIATSFLQPTLKTGENYVKSWPPRGRFQAAPAAGFGLHSDHFCASFESIWITKDLGFGLISTRAFQRCVGLVLNRKNQIFINFLTPEGGAQKQGGGVRLKPGIKLLPESDCGSLKSVLVASSLQRTVGFGSWISRALLRGGGTRDGR